MTSHHIGEKNGWAYTATVRGKPEDNRFSVARAKRGKRIFIGTANGLEQAKTMARADMQDRR